MLERALTFTANHPMVSLGFTLPIVTIGTVALTVTTIFVATQIYVRRSGDHSAGAGIAYMMLGGGAAATKIGVYLSFAIWGGLLIWGRLLGYHLPALQEQAQLAQDLAYLRGLRQAS